MPIQCQLTVTNVIYLNKVNQRSKQVNFENIVFYCIELRLLLVGIIIVIIIGCGII